MAQPRLRWICNPAETITPLVPSILKLRNIRTNFKTTLQSHRRIVNPAKQELTVSQRIKNEVYYTNIIDS